MGQQQLLLIVLGVIIVGIAVVVGINLFNANATNANRDGVISDLNNLGAMAQQYYKKPREMGGGNKTFMGWDVPSQLLNTANGSYMADVQANQVIITGTGTEVVTGTDSIKVQTTVTANDYFSIVIN